MTSNVQPKKLDRVRTNISDGGPVPRRSSKSTEFFERSKTDVGVERKLSIVTERQPSGARERKQGVQERKPSVPGRKQSVSVSERKQSMGVGRKRSLNPLQANMRKCSLEPSPIGGQRRMSIFGDRDSQSTSDRRTSIVDSMYGGRSAFLMTGMGQRPSTGVKYDNSYRLEPIQKVQTNDIRKCIKDVFDEELPEKEYVMDQTCALSKTLAEAIKQRVKYLGYFRHKIISTVAIGQLDDHCPSATFTSRCVCNDKFDTSQDYTFTNDSLYAVGMVYLLYTE